MRMIFDSPYVTDLVEEWKRTKDPKVLDVILQQSLPLIEVIVSNFDSIYREDLIQEASIRVQYAIQFFDPKIANLYTYLATVIKNICLSYIRKQSRHNAEFCYDEMSENVVCVDELEKDTDLLSLLIARNRSRFPSISVDTIDAITELIYYSLLGGDKKTNTVNTIISMYNLTKNEACVVYNSVVLYLRVYFREFASIQAEGYDEEFSILPDLVEIFGKRTADMISVAFTGMTIKFP